MALLCSFYWLSIIPSWVCTTPACSIHPSLITCYGQGSTMGSSIAPFYPTLWKSYMLSLFHCNLWDDITGRQMDLLLNTLLIFSLLRWRHLIGRAHKGFWLVHTVGTCNTLFSIFNLLLIHKNKNNTWDSTTLAFPEKWGKKWKYRASSICSEAELLAHLLRCGVLSSVLRILPVTHHSTGIGRSYSSLSLCWFIY